MIDRNEAAGAPLPNALSRMNEDTDLGLRDILRIVRRRLALLAGIVGSAVLLAAIVLSQLPAIYTAEALVLIENKPANIMADTVVAGLSGDKETVQSEAFVLSSRRLASRVIDRLKLDQVKEFNPDAGKTDKPPPAKSGGDPAPDAMAVEQGRARVLEMFTDNLMISPMQDSRVIAVRFESRQPELAANVANAIADEYIQSRIEAKFESTKRASVWLSQRIQQLREEVEKAERNVATMRKDFGLLGGNGQSLSSQEMVELNTQLIEARSARAEAEAELQQVRLLVNSPGGVDTSSQVLKSPLIQRLREQQVSVERRVAELSSELGEKHPQMVQLRADAADLHARIDAEIAKIVTGLENQVSVAQSREQAIQQTLRGIKEQVGRGNQNEVRLRSVERDADANRQLLATLLAREKETLSQEDIGFQQADARVISPAELPVEPSFPKIGIILGLVFLGSTLLALLIIMVVEQLDRGFRSGDEVERATGLPSLGFVPQSGTIFSAEKTAVSYLTERPKTPFAESIRTLDWSLTLSFPERPKVVLIASSEPDEGKTTIAATLAAIFKQAGRKTLLVDADTRRPSVQVLFGVAREPGLVDVLIGQTTIEEAIVDCSEYGGPDLLPAGSESPNAINLLGSVRMRELLTELRGRYEAIVIDSPPVLAGADVRVLATLVDTTVFCVRWAHTRREVVRLALRQLLGAGANVVGVLLTVVDVKKHAKYGYGDSGAYTGDLEKYYAG